MNEKDKISTNKGTTENAIYNDEKKYKFEDTGILNNKIDEEINNNSIKNENKKISFWEFLIYKLRLKKKNNKIKLYEDLRIKIISVENLIISHLNIYKLLNMKDNICQ